MQCFKQAKNAFMSGLYNYLDHYHVRLFVVY